jgi:hypothetical protein
MKNRGMYQNRGGWILHVLLVGACVAMTAATVRAQNPNLGTSGAQFLKIPVGARAAAMGGAFMGAAGDASALFWNPAGIVQLRGGEVFAAHTPWWASTRLSNAAAAYTIEGVGSFGLSLSLLTMDKMEVTTEVSPEGTGESFDAQDLMIGLSFARRLTEDFSVGVTAKYVSQRIWNETASGIAFDVGTQYRVGFRDLTLAMSMTNFGPDMRYNGRDLAVKFNPSSLNAENRLIPAELSAEDFPLPLGFQVGISMTALEFDGVALLLAIDATHPNDNKERINTGAELTVLERLFLRGGYRFGYDTERATMGAGVAVPVGTSVIRFDYGYATYDLLPNISRFSLSMSF